MSIKDTNDFSPQIKVSGLPFMLQGWNTTFNRTDKLSENAPVYKLDRYNLYWMISIIGAIIYKLNGKWVFRRNCDRDPIFVKSDKDGQLTPYGKWECIEPYNRVYEEMSFTVLPVY